MQKHISIKVTGKVQGVFFRASTREVASKLGLNRFCSGTSPMAASTSKRRVKKRSLVELTAWCRQGPRLAQVDHLDIKEGKWEGFRDFVISH